MVRRESPTKILDICPNLKIQKQTNIQTLKATSESLDKLTTQITLSNLITSVTSIDLITLSTLTVRDGQILGHCSIFRAIANFKFGAMPQIWVKSQFSTWKLNGKICYQQAIIIHGHVQNLVVYSYVLH